MLIAKSTADLSKQMGSLIFSVGTVSIIEYILGISPIDPMPPHYFCPTCERVDTDVNVEDGFDLPRKVCPHCGKEMWRDGHNCSESLFAVALFEYKKGKFIYNTDVQGFWNYPMDETELGPVRFYEDQNLLLFCLQTAGGQEGIAVVWDTAWQRLIFIVDVTYCEDLILVEDKLLVLDEVRYSEKIISRSKGYSLAF